VTVSDVERRELAIKRIKAKNDFKVHLLVYLTINTMLVVVWFFSDGFIQTTTGTRIGFFWPIFPIAGWGAGLIAHWYTVYFGDAYSEDQIQREMGKLPR
jgi:2TM domain